MRSPFELMLPLISHPLGWDSDDGEGELTGGATGVPPPARRWARQSHGTTNVLLQMPRFAVRALPSSPTNSCEYRRYATAQPSRTIQPLMLAPPTLQAATRRP